MTGLLNTKCISIGGGNSNLVKSPRMGWLAALPTLQTHTQDATFARVATNLENMENLENSGNFKNCQNLREI